MPENILSISKENGKIKLVVQCAKCGLQKALLIEVWDYSEWVQGKSIQNAMPYISPADRELILSATCDSCFKLAVSSQEDE